MHYDMRHNPKVECLRDMGGGLVALGRWLVLMSILYDSDGVYDVNSAPKRSYLCRELELDEYGLEEFLRQCADSELINVDLLNVGHVASDGICEQLDYVRRKSEAGKKGMAKRWGKDAKDAK